MEATVCRPWMVDTSKQRILRGSMREPQLALQLERLVELVRSEWTLRPLRFTLQEQRGVAPRGAHERPLRDPRGVRTRTAAEETAESMCSRSFVSLGCTSTSTETGT